MKLRYTNKELEKTYGDIEIQEGIIGRNPDAVKIVTPRTVGSVSRIHAEFVKSDEGWRIRDLGSRYGTFVNDKKIGGDYVNIRPGDKIKLSPDLEYLVAE